MIPKPHDLSFCFFPEGFFAPALTDLLCSGLMVALQTDTASPAAKIFLLNMPAITTPFRARKPSIYFDVISPIPTAFIG
ncbi:MAG: hypothetical protein EWV69_22010 [Microcystis panniformis Mp_MB_F_20080800_S26]|nr:MAG: hypothetical protein EWV69_22010 [Microcystis panniformis Mp_MB_F_20080800_S26]